MNRSNEWLRLGDVVELLAVDVTYLCRRVEKVPRARAIVRAFTDDIRPHVNWAGGAM